MRAKCHFLILSSPLELLPATADLQLKDEALRWAHVGGGISRTRRTTMFKLENTVSKSVSLDHVPFEGRTIHEKGNIQLGHIIV